MVVWVGGLRGWGPAKASFQQPAASLEPHCELLLTLTLLLLPLLLLRLQAVFIPPSVADGVSRIIDSVVGSLLTNPDRTFTFADTVSGRGGGGGGCSRV